MPSAARTARAGAPSAIPGVYVASLSFRTVTYKALCAAAQLARFYPDLEDPELAVPFAIFHQRFSTNTEPSWERAQPFRLLCHNGEINTIDGNVTWTDARERRSRRRARARAGARSSRLGLRAPRQRARAARPRDDGVDVAEALSVLVPPAWQNDPRLDEEVRDFHRFGAMLSEPWDGPAALCFTDGRTCGAALDRNGLRPLRVAIAGDELLAVSSEAGAVPLPDGVPVRRARLGPGGMLTLDPDRGLLVDAELRREHCTAPPVRRLGRQQRRPGRRRRPVAPPGELARRAPRPPRLHAGGAERDAATARAGRPRPRVVDGGRLAPSRRSPGGTVR